jgi:hypothetical protein
MATLAVTNSFSAGTTIVAADMNENFDDVEAFVNSTPGVVQNDIVDAKGDLIAATGSDAVSRLAVGTNTYVLTADSTEATGLIWSAPTTGDLTGLTAGNLVDITAASGPVPTIDVDLSEASTSTSDADGDYFIVTDAASAQLITPKRSMPSVEPVAVHSLLTSLWAMSRRQRLIRQRIRSRSITRHLTLSRVRLL